MPFLKQLILCLNTEKTITVKYATYAVAKIRPEEIQVFRDPTPAKPVQQSSQLSWQANWE